jgi:hypothetical protein
VAGLLAERTPVTSAIFAKKAKTFSHGNGTATEKAFHFRESSTSVGDKFFLVAARPRWERTLD